MILGAMGLVTLMGADWLLGKVLRVDQPMLQASWMALSLLGGLGIVPTRFTSDLTWWQVLITASSFCAVWAFFGGAVLRTAALRLTRDEPLSIGEALRFSCRNWLTYLSAPLVVVLFAGFFVLCNMAAGLLMSIWGLGSSILVIFLFPLVLVSSLMITLSVLGGLISMPLIWAAISVEQNGALEAVSRTFSYLFARPFRFFFGLFLIGMLASIIGFVSAHYEGTLKDTLKWGIVRGDLEDVVSRAPQSVGRFQNEYENKDKTRQQARGISDIRNSRDARWYDWLGFVWMWLLINIFMLCFKGYAVYVVLGGTASLYLQLRHDVDGAAESEIYPPIDDDPEPSGGAAKWVGETENPTETPADGEDAPSGE